jgi:adenosine kinase
MAALICGSLAFDTIMTFEGRFAEQILPAQLHILNVSFLVPTLRRDFGGCAGNIAYSLKLLGGDPCHGHAGRRRRRYLAAPATAGHRHPLVGQAGDTYTAQAMIMTDRDNNQITAFHPGAMMQAHANRIGAGCRRTNRHHRPGWARCHAAARGAVCAAGIPFVFDPGQGLPMFNGDELRRFIEQAAGLR